MPGAEPLSIVQVTPHPWGKPHQVNDFVENVSGELVARGHRVLIAAPSETRARVRESRRVLKDALEADDPDALFASEELTRSVGGARVLAVGQGIPLPRSASPRGAPMPLDVSRSLERLLTFAAPSIDIVHVHDPFVPSTSSTALRHSWSLNVGTFHETTERVLSTQVARPIFEIFFGRLDARTASSAGAAETMGRYFPGAYELTPFGCEDSSEAWWPGEAGADGERGPLRIAYIGDEERGALRLFLRALRRMATDRGWEAVVWEGGPDPLRGTSAALRGKVRAVRASDCTREELIAAADVVVAASGGPSPAPATLRNAIANGTIPVASQLPIHVELTDDGESGLLFPPGDSITLAGQLSRLAREPRLRSRLLRRGAAQRRSWADLSAEFEGIYRRVLDRRHDPAGDAAVRKRIASRALIEVDLHMHTDHSPDCATPVDVLLETAKDRGLGAIAITDHNEISGAIEAVSVAERIGGIKVIVSEEVKTAEQGEVIGLFLKEKIRRGMSMRETIAEIRRQGGLVYVPHPFDRLHSVPDYEHLLEMVEEIDILEVFNPRVTLSAFNDEAERFAAKYRIVPGAGSDSHVAQGLGSVRIRMRDFDGPAEFLEAMRDADITRRHKNMVYVQALKWVQTAGGRGGARADRSGPAAAPPKGGTRRSTRRAAAVRSKPVRGGSKRSAGKAR